MLLHVMLSHLLYFRLMLSCLCWLSLNFQDAGLNLIINDAGAISMSVKSGKDNTLLVSYQKNLNDGNWHLVQVLQSDKK